MKMNKKELRKFKKKVVEKRTKKNTSFYDELCSIDIIDPIMELYDRRVIIPGLDGKIRVRAHIPLNRTWTFANICHDRKCGKWLHLYNQYYKILPPPCKQCWKIVYAPRTVTELIHIREIQAKMNLPAKCGIEKRDYTSGLGGYRAFWYCPFFGGLKGGREHFKLINEYLVKELGEVYIHDMRREGRFFLKRGCTELERDFGPSDKWDKYDFSAKFKLLETVWEDPEELEREWTPLVYTNTKRWIEFAIAHGDLSALSYINSSTMGVQAVRYENSDHKENDYNKNYIDSLNETIEEGRENVREGKENLFRFESEES